MESVAEILRIVLFTLLGLSGVVGLLAIVSPQAFTVVASYGGRPIHVAGKGSARRWFDIDQFVIEHARIFGLMIVFSESFIWCLSSYGPDSYSKSFLLIAFCLMLLVGFLAVGHILRQKREIETKLAEAHTDPLTGLANRRAFDLELSRRLAQRQRVGTPLCLQIIDIDNFKPFNDEFGHLLGDEILKEIARAFTAAAGPEDMVARLGGDEFAVIQLGCDLKEASRSAERFRTAVGSAPIRYDGREHALTISSGVAEAQPDDDRETLIKRADSALYAAKEAGRNCCFRSGKPELATTDLDTHLPAVTCPIDFQPKSIT